VRRIVLGSITGPVIENQRCESRIVLSAKKVACVICFLKHIRVWIDDDEQSAFGIDTSGNGGRA
jgi:hypothetical protein